MCRARKWQSKNWDPDMAGSKFKVSHSQGSLFKTRTSSSKKNNCPVSQREVGKGCLLVLLPAYTSCRKMPQEPQPCCRARPDRQLPGNWAPAAWVLPVASLWTLFNSSCLRSQPGTRLLFEEKECSCLALFWDEVAGPVET